MSLSVGIGGAGGGVKVGLEQGYWGVDRECWGLKRVWGMGGGGYLRRVHQERLAGPEPPPAARGACSHRAYLDQGGLELGTRWSEGCWYGYNSSSYHGYNSSSYHMVAF